MKRGFTLIELIIVIIILGILSTIAFSQYQKVIEKGRSAEAKTLLGQIATAESAYYLQNNKYLNTSTDMDDYLGLDNAPHNTCDGLHFFSYSVTTGGTITATRCTTSSKNPNAKNAYTATLIIDTRQLTEQTTGVE